MILGNKAYISDIHNSVFSTLETDAACHPPKMSIQFCPTVMLQSIYNEITVLTNKLHSLQSYFNPVCTYINSH
jgi:hypothetical protein